MVAKRTGIETSKGAKRPGGETSRWRTGRVAKRLVTAMSRSSIVETIKLLRTEHKMFQGELKVVTTERKLLATF